MIGNDEIKKGNPVITKREKHLRNNNTSRGPHSRLDNATSSINDKSKERNSIFDLHKRDSIDSMMIGAKTRKIDLTSRKGSANPRENSAIDGISANNSVYQVSSRIDS